MHKIHPKVVPYLITSRFFKNIGKPRSAEDTVLTDMEALEGPHLVSS